MGGPDSSSLLPSCCVFDSESTCGGHSRLSSPIHESRSLSSVRVHIHSSSALFVGTVNLAKEVVGNFHLLWIVRALAKWQGGGYLPGYFPSLHGYIPRAVSLSSDLCRCRTRIVVVESASSLSNLFRYQIRVMVVVVASKIGSDLPMAMKIRFRTNNIV